MQLTSNKIQIVHQPHQPKLFNVGIIQKGESKPNSLILLQTCIRTKTINRLISIYKNSQECTMTVILKQILYTTYVGQKLPKLTADANLATMFQLDSSMSICGSFFSTAAPLTLKGLMRRTTSTEGLKLGIQEVQYIICQTSYSRIKISPLHCSNHPTKFTCERTLSTYQPLGSMFSYEI